MRGPAEQRAQPAGLCATAVMRFAARRCQHPRYNRGAHCINWGFVRKLAVQPVLPKATCEGVMCEKCTWAHLYFTNPLDASEPTADPASTPAGSEKPWHLWQMVYNQDVKVYLCVSAHSRGGCVSCITIIPCHCNL